MIHHGDCLEVMATMEAESIDAIVTDPPYGLEFMGKEWDRLQSSTKGRQDLRAALKGERVAGGEFGERIGIAYGTPHKNPRCRKCYRLKHDHEKSRCACAEPDWDLRKSEYGYAMQWWHEAWAREAFRIAKPGAHLLAFGGTRTYHRLACAIEDAGWEVRDCLVWAYASGFPKSLDVSKAIDKARDDYPAIRSVVEFIRSAASGRSAESIAEALGWGPAVVAHFLAPSRSNAGCPQWDQWLALKALLGFGDEMDAEVWRLNGRKGKPGEAWDQREIVGRSDELLGRRSGIGNATDGHYTVGGTKAEPYTITAPATPEAAKWQGWGTALKPAWEPIILARKPLRGTVAANVQRYGVGALNIDGCRIVGAPTAIMDAWEGDPYLCASCAADAASPARRGTRATRASTTPRHAELLPNDSATSAGTAGGPATSVSSGTTEARGGTSSSTARSGRTPTAPSPTGASSTTSTGTRPTTDSRTCRSCGAISTGTTTIGDTTSIPSEPLAGTTSVGTEPGRWPANLVLTSPIFDGDTPGVVGGGETTGSASGHRIAPRGGHKFGGDPGQNATLPGLWHGDSGTYSRFFLIPKAARADREPVLGGLPAEVRTMGRGLTGVSGDRSGRGGAARPIEAGAAKRANVHPTVKPTELMRHLVRLVTPPGGTVLDPFLGSGTTALAAEMEGFAWVGIEKEAEYVAIAEARLNGTQRGFGLTG